MSLRRATALAATLLLTAANAFSQGFPSKTITMVVPFPPGGATDPIARLFAAKLGEAWKVPVIVDNKPGAGTTIGMGAVARAAPDGYTVVVATTSLGTNPVLYSKLPYDTVKDFTPLSLAVILPGALVVNPQLPVNSLPELVAYLKARPGQANFSSAGNGTINHLAGELFKSMAGVDVVHVPYKGSGPAVAAVLAGDVSFVFDTFYTLQPLVKAGRLKAIASSGLRRIEALPDLQTVGETYTGFAASSWLGFMGPANMPPDIAKKWSDEISRIALMPDVKERLAAQGADAVGSNQADFRTFIEGEIAKWQKVVEKAKIPKME